MFRLTVGLVTLGVLSVGAEPFRPALAAWPHRAMLTALHQRPVRFRAYTLGKATTACTWSSAVTRGAASLESRRMGGSSPSDSSGTVSSLSLAEDTR